MNKDQIVSAREMQRNYRTLINRVKRTKQPVFLGTRGKLEAVLIDGEDFLRRTDNGKPTISAAALTSEMEKFRSKGRRDVSLVKFLRNDRDSR